VVAAMSWVAAMSELRQIGGCGNAVGRGNAVVSVGALRAEASKPVLATKTHGGCRGSYGPRHLWESQQCRGRGNAGGRGNVVVSVGALRAAASKPALAAKNAWGNVVVPTFMPDSNIFIGSRHAFWAALAGPLVSLLFL
jgi:hypothetical protein